jgi:hypothetical protein
MIDLQKEKILALPQAAKLIPSNRNGKGTHVSTVLRWIQKGVKGVRLEATRPGGKWVTSAEALQRFADRLAASQSVEAPPFPQPSRRSAAEKADEELKKMGF